MIVAGIDPSLTSAGVAILKDGQPVHVSHHGYPGHDGASWQARSRRVRWTVRKVMEALTGTCADLVLMEGPSYGSQHGSAFDRSGLWHGIFGALDASLVPIAVVAPRTRAKWATGKDVEGNGNSGKREVYDAVSDEWKPHRVTLSSFTKGGNDEADALTMAAMGALWLGDTLPIAVPDWRVNGLTAVAWPVIA